MPMLKRSFPYRILPCFSRSRERRRPGQKSIGDQRHAYRDRVATASPNYLVSGQIGTVIIGLS